MKEAVILDVVLFQRSWGFSNERRWLLSTEVFRLTELELQFFSCVAHILYRAKEYWADPLGWFRAACCVRWTRERFQGVRYSEMV